VFADQARQHLAHFHNNRIQIQNARLQNLHPTERQQLPSHAYGAAGGFLNLLYVSLATFIGRHAIREHVRVPSNNGEEIIEIVRDPSRKPANGFHLVRLAQTRLEFSLLELDFLQTITHAPKSPSHYRYFILAAALQKEATIPSLKGSHARNEIAQGPSKRIREHETEQSSHGNGEQAEAKKYAIQLRQEERCLVKRSENAEASSRHGST